MPFTLNQMPCIPYDNPYNLCTNFEPYSLCLIPISLIVQWFPLCTRCNTWGQQMKENNRKNIMENSCVNFPRVRYQYKGLPRFEPLWMRVVAQANRGENLWSSAQKSLYPCIKGDENWNPDFKTRTARPHNPTKRPSLIEELSQVAELQHFLGGGWICQQVH